MLTDFGLAHPSINPARRKQIKSVPDNKSDTMFNKPKHSSYFLNVRYFLIFCNYLVTVVLLTFKNCYRLIISDLVQ